MTTHVSIACNLSALDKSEQQRRQQVASTLLAAAEIIPASDGYTFRFREHKTDLRQVAEFISLERRCCPFLEFQIELGGGNELVTLRIRGRKNVKEFLAAELGLGAIADRAGTRKN